jgi:hypothetical protein
MAEIAKKYFITNLRKAALQQAALLFYEQKTQNILMAKWLIYNEKHYITKNHLP